MKLRSFQAAIVGISLAGGVLTTATGAAALARTEVKRIVVEEARKSRVPPALAMAVAKVESNFNDRALSSAGARGVMQIMPATGRGVFKVEASELWKPRSNVQLGISFLDQLRRQYGDWDLALSHYNGGSLKRGADGKFKPHGYTRKYVAAVKRWWRRYEQEAGYQRVASRDSKLNGRDPRLIKTASRERMPQLGQSKRSGLAGAVRFFLSN